MSIQALCRLSTDVVWDDPQGSIHYSSRRQLDDVEYVTLSTRPRDLV